MESGRKMTLYKLVSVCMVVSLITALCLFAACQPRTRDATADQVATEAPSNEETIEQVAFTFTMEAECGTCHTTELASETDASLLCSKHVTQENVGCITCHADTPALSASHAEVSIGDKTPKKLKTTEVPDTICFSCHEDYTLLAEITATSTALTDANGTVINPHAALNLNAEHAEVLSCAQCHNMHKEANYQAVCASCHHMNVYECNTCHEA